MTTDLTTLLAEADAVSAAATPGPWKLVEARTSCGRAFRIGTGEMIIAGKGCCIIYDDYPGSPANERSANAAFIAASRDLIPRLVATCREQMAEIERMNGLMSAARFLLWWKDKGKPIDDAIEAWDALRAALQPAGKDTP